MKKVFSFSNTKVEIDYLNKTVSSIFFEGEELIFGDVPFFTLKFRSRDAEKTYLSAKEFEFVNCYDSIAEYHHKDADVFLKIEQVENGLRWGIRVNNHTDLLLEQVELMSLGLFPTLLDDGGRGEIDIPYNEGARVTSLERRQASSFCYQEVNYPSQGVYFMYPNMISSPFMAYITNGKGIYLGMHDKSCTPKHIDFHSIGTSFNTEFSVFTNVDYGEDYEMNFDSLMLFFQGDYIDACEIYRTWFYENKPEELKTIKEQYDKFPKWYHESPVVVTYPILGAKDMDTKMEPGGLYPYTNALKVIDHFKEKTNAHYMVTLMQWESTAPWAPPYVWPPYGDVANFYEFRDKLHAKGHYLGLYTSGFGWTNKSLRKPYDKTEEFEKRGLAAIMCTDSNGVMKSTIVSDIRNGFDICPKLELSKKIFVDEANKMVDAKIDYVQILDQNHGGNPYFCYSDKHGHVPAPGSWQVKETKELLNRIDRSTCLLGCESAASEPYINELKFSDNRYILNYIIGEPIPMYSYIYHEFVNNFMGNQICNRLVEERYALTYRMAYSFINGDLYTLIIDGNGKIHTAWCDDLIVNEEMPLTLIKNTNKWRSGRFEEFLHYGKVVRPVKYECAKKSFVFTNGLPHTFNFDAVLSSAYTNGNETYQFFINYDNVDETIKLPFDKPIVFFEPNGKEQQLTSKEVIVPALSMVAVKIN